MPGKHRACTVSGHARGETQTMGACKAGLDDCMLIRAWGGRRPRAAGYFPEVGKVRLHGIICTSICASRQPLAMIAGAATVVRCLTVCVVLRKAWEHWGAPAYYP